MYMCGGTHVSLTMPVWRSEDNLLELVLSFNHILQPGGFQGLDTLYQSWWQAPYLLGHFTGSCISLKN